MDGERTTDGTAPPDPDGALRREEVDAGAPAGLPAPIVAAELEPDGGSEPEPVGTAAAAATDATSHDPEPAADARAGHDAGAQTSTSGRGSRRPGAWNRPTAIAASTAVALVLGFGLTVQIRSVSEPEAQVATREEDLVLILEELNTREAELRREIARTRQTVEELSTGQRQSDRAIEEARARAEAIGILNGTLPASGPGVVVTIQDPDGAVPASVVLDAIQELRGAGAEAMQVDGVRVVVSSAVSGSPGTLRIDGIPLDSPYEFRVVGPPAAMEVALNVSGGVVSDVGRVGGTAVVRQADVVSVDATVD